MPWAENGIDGNGDNQKWAKSDYTINVLSGLSPSETYTLEAYWKITTNVGDKLDDNSGSNVKSTFTVDSSLSVESFNQNNAVSMLSNEIYFHRNGTFEISVYNLLGMKVKRIENTFNKNHILPLYLEKGIYLVQVRENQHLNNYKMLVR